MKTHAIIPVFIPHSGCPHDCIFCNQRAITARQSAPDRQETVRIIEEHLSTIEKNPHITRREIAFYGGSFTGIPASEQEMYLSAAKEYKDAGRVDAIHLSTRPDYIDEEILDRLQRYSVDIVELGVQSFDEEVLRRSRRGHDREIVYRSAEMIKKRGITLGIQLMAGLPGDSYEKCMKSVRETVKIGPAIARIYPTVVLRDTGLYEMYRKGMYEPLSEEDAVNTVKDMLREFERAGIDVIRVGLKSSDGISEGGDAVAAGSYHPAFRQLTESAMAREDIEEILLKRLSEIPPERRNRLKTTFYSAPESFSNMTGLRKSNRLYFQEQYPELNLKFAVDTTLQRNKYRVSVEFDKNL